MKTDLETKNSPATFSFEVDVAVFAALSIFFFVNADILLSATGMLDSVFLIDTSFTSVSSWISRCRVGKSAFVTFPSAACR